MVVGAFILYAGETNAFDDAVQILLVKMAQDISFALDPVRARGRAESDEGRAARKRRPFPRAYEKAPLPYQSLDIEGHILEVNDAWLESPWLWTGRGRRALYW